jgi:DNA replication licensing factor MCM7
VFHRSRCCPCRFDILWLILDQANEESDRQLADHVLSVHQLGTVPTREHQHAPLTPEQLRVYVAMAKQHAPKIPEDLTEYVAAIYSEIRRQEAMSDRPNSYTTPRTLLSILRLSQALAKLRFDNMVRNPFV